MDHFREATVLANDLDSMLHRIEALPPHPRYTDAHNAIVLAHAAVLDGLTGLHQADIVARYPRSKS